MKAKNMCFICIIGLLVSYKQTITVTSKSESDTSKVLELALRTAFYHQNLAEASSLFSPFHFKDSILFTSDSLDLTMLPKRMDSLKFKILSHRQMDSLFDLENDLRKIPAYPDIIVFEKNDSGYYVQVQSRRGLGIGLIPWPRALPLLRSLYGCLKVA